ncbi:hypothetical protein Tco_0699652 [Tanacetum coccineum]
MSLFKTPMKVLNTIESNRGKFFNGMDLNENKMAWVSWSNVLASKQKGGLGVLSFYALNKALLFKWVWRFQSQNSSLWACFIKAIHGDDGHLISMPKVSRSSIWLDIVREEAYKNVSVANKIGSNNFCDSFRRLPRGGAESEKFNELSSNLSCVILPQTQDRAHCAMALDQHQSDVESQLAQPVLSDDTAPLLRQLECEYSGSRQLIGIRNSPLWKGVILLYQL